MLRCCRAFSTSLIHGRIDLAKKRDVRHICPSYSNHVRYYTQERHATDLELEEQELEDEARLRQLTANARTLVRARRTADATKIIDEGLSLFPWHSSLWFWKIATKIGDSTGAIEVWDTMSRMSIEKRPEHYDIMANAIISGSARHFVLDMFKEMVHTGLVGNPKFYVQLFYACGPSSGSTVLAESAQSVWSTMQRDPKLVHLTQDAEVSAAYRNHISTKSDSLPTSKPDEQVAAHAVLPKTSSLLGATKDTGSQVDGVQLNTLDSPSYAKSHAESRSPQSLPSPLYRTQNISKFGAPASEVKALLEPHFQAKFRTNSVQHRQSLREARDLIRQSASPNIETYNYVLRSGSSIMKPEEMMQMLEEATEQGMRPDCRTYNPIIKRYFSANQPEEALSLIDRMESTNVKFDYRTLIQIFRGLAQNDKLDIALEFFVDLFQGGSNLQIILEKDGEINCFSAMIEILAQAGRYTEARKLLSIMVQRGLEPSLSIYTALASCAFEEGNPIEAMTYYNLATKPSDLQRINSNWKYDLDSLVSTVVQGFLQQDRYEEAETFMINAAKDKHWHNTTSRPYVQFIRWLAQNDRIDEAWGLFDLHQNKYPGPDAAALYSAILENVYLRLGNIEDGMSWFRKMQKECHTIDQRTYAVLVGSAMINGERGAAESVWSEAMDHIQATGQRCSRRLAKEGERWGFQRET